MLTTGLAKPFLQQQAESQESNLALTNLKSFVKVYLECERIRLSYELNIDSVQGYGRSENIESEARSKLYQVLTKRGLTPEVYSRMIKTLNTNPTLRARAMRLIHQECRHL